MDWSMFRGTTKVVPKIQRDRLPAFLAFAQRAFIWIESLFLTDADMDRRPLTLGEPFVETAA